MADNAQGPKPDAEVKGTEVRREDWPTYKKPSSIGSYLLFLLFLAIAGVIVYYVLFRKEQASTFWNRLTHRDAVPAQVEPGK